ncbi:flippase [Pelagicoccus sp. SDUM812003]|uniref:flippase n=1 Tax=Pelagicoccus sp. SDUM812003 TaxID=3041267 RepID=UPI00280EAE8A|nr:flippase [Pelagicoccus sp. SDUM812003]MDQ8204660.1 flippase [Pelagicoccus sp. SDUM812003]
MRSYATKLPIPGFLRGALNSPGAKKVLNNFAWLVGERGITLLLALFVNIWLARYLGPELFGELSYVIAFVGLFGAFTYLGINGIAVRDLIEEKEKADEILGTVFALKVGGSLLGIAAILAFTWGRSAQANQLLISLLSISMLFDSLGVIGFFFQSKLDAKTTTRATAYSQIVSALLKILLIVLKGPLIAFVLVTLFEYIARSLALVYLYQSSGSSISRWSFRWKRAKSLLQQSWPLILSGIGSIIYLRIDQVMIAEMLDTTEVGIYAVAVKFSEVWYFIPTALAASLFPTIIRYKKQDSAIYQQKMQRLYRIMVLLALGIALAVTLTSGLLINTLFDPAYARAADILRIHIWACPSIFMAAVLSKWLISERLLIFSLVRHGLGAIANVGLNLVLIPRYGATGAAIATVVSYTISSYLACFSYKRTSRTGLMMTKALLTPFKDFKKLPAMVSPASNS